MLLKINKLLTMLLCLLICACGSSENSASASVNNFNLTNGQYLIISDDTDVTYKESRYSAGYTNYSEKLLKGDTVVLLSSYVLVSKNKIYVKAYKKNTSIISVNATGFIDSNKILPVLIAKKNTSLLDGNGQHIAAVVVNTQLVLTEQVDDLWYKVIYDNGIEGYVRISDTTPYVKNNIYIPAPDGLNSISDNITNNILYLVHAMQNVGSVVNTGSAYVDGVLSFNCSGFTHLVFKLAGLKNGAYKYRDHFFTAYEQFNSVQFNKILNLLDTFSLAKNEGEFNYEGTSYVNFKEYLTSTLMPGDLIFFITSMAEKYDKTKISHIGVYMGDGRVFHNATPLGIVNVDLWDYSSKSGISELTDNNLNNIIGITRLKDEFKTAAEVVNLDDAVSENKILIEGYVPLNLEISISKDLYLKGSFELDEKYLGKSKYVFNAIDRKLTKSEWDAVNNTISATKTEFTYGSNNQGVYYLHVLLADEQNESEIISGKIFID